MICHTCAAAGQKSTVREGLVTRTLMHCPPFYDEDGKRHHHDSNTTGTDYSCSQGHRWTERTKGSCWCGWPGSTSAPPAKP